MDVQGPSGERILVTGGAGFIGSHLAEALVGNNEVVVLDSLDAGKREHVPDRATLVEGDVRDGDLLDSTVADVDRIFHQAAIVSVPRSVRKPAVSHEVNLSGSIQLLEAARRHDTPVVLASSAAIYGPPEQLPVPESHRRRPNSPYGLEKLAMDEYARLYHEHYGLQTVALRYFNVYGPRQTAGQYAGVIGNFRDRAVAGDPLEIEGDGAQTRDFVHVSDVVRANLLAATTDGVAGTALNVGTGTETSIAELAHAVQSVSRTDPNITHVEPRQGDIRRSVADISRASRVLGFEPSVPLEDGLRTLLSR